MNVELEILQLERLVAGLDVELTVMRADHRALISKIATTETLRSELQIRVNDLKQLTLDV